MGQNASRPTTADRQDIESTHIIEYDVHWADQLRALLACYDCLVDNAAGAGVRAFSADGNEIEILNISPRHFPVRIGFPHRPTTPVALVPQPMPLPIPIAPAQIDLENHQALESRSVVVYGLDVLQQEHVGTLQELNFNARYGMTVVEVQDCFCGVNHEPTAATVIEMNQRLWCGFTSDHTGAQTEGERIAAFLGHEMRPLPLHRHVATAGFRVQPDWIGRSLGAINFRATYGVNILGIVPSSSRLNITWFPAVDMELEDGCELLVAPHDLCKLQGIAPVPEAPVQEEPVQEEPVQEEPVPEAPVPEAPAPAPRFTSNVTRTDAESRLQELLSGCFDITNRWHMRNMRADHAAELGDDWKWLQVQNFSGNLIGVVRITKDMTARDLRVKVASLQGLRPQYIRLGYQGGSPTSSSRLSEVLTWPTRRNRTLSQHVCLDIPMAAYRSLAYRRMSNAQVAVLLNYVCGGGEFKRVVAAGKQMRDIVLGFCLKPREFCVCSGEEAIEEFGAWGLSRYLVDSANLTNDLMDLLTFPHQGATYIAVVQAWIAARRKP